VTASAPRTPLDIMLSIAQHFIEQAEAFDTKVRAAVAASAGEREIQLLMSFADDSRMKALAAAGQAAPYTQPKLSAVEFSPASPLTQSRFDVRLEALTDEEVSEALRQIEQGQSALKLLELAEPATEAIMSAEPPDEP